MEVVIWRPVVAGAGDRPGRWRDQPAGLPEPGGYPITGKGQGVLARGSRPSASARRTAARRVFTPSLL